jgi:hypothetical protein
MHLVSVYLINVHLMGVHLVGVHLTGVRVPGSTTTSSGTRPLVLISDDDQNNMDEKGFIKGDVKVLIPAIEEEVFSK